MKPIRFLNAAAVFLSLQLLGLNAGGLSAWGGELDPGLEVILKSTSPQQEVSVLVYLTDQVNLTTINEEMAGQNATAQRTHETVVSALQVLAETTQKDIIAYLSARKKEGKVKDFESFWITNAVRVDAEKAEIERIAERRDVARIYYNYEVELVEPVEIKRHIGGAVTSVEIGVEAVRAPEVWAVGATGSGVLVANMDSGVDGSHPALADRWAGVADPRYDGHPEWAWYDPYLNQNDFPYDYNGHGTHTMGSLTGAEPGDTVGVAPGATWIASAPVGRGGGIPEMIADIILCFEWMIDPDGNPSTDWDVPDVCSNSWGVRDAQGYPPCDELFWSYLDACEAAGTLILFAAGNMGDAGLDRPADRATDDYRTLAVASVNAHDPDWPIAGSSSRGPTYCTPGGDAAIKPDIAAPGVNVRSCYPGGNYFIMSGTSMAAPHVAGVVALIRQVDPDLTINELKQVMYDAAFDVGDPGEDNDYGWGMVDAFEAVRLVMADFGYVEGYVTDASSSEPLPADVEIAGYWASTQAGESGYYILGALPETTYTVRASYFGYFPQEVLVSFSAEDTVSLDFQLDQVPPPVVSCSPSSFNVYIQPGDIEERYLTIYNDGDGPLYYTLTEEIFDHGFRGGDGNKALLTQGPASFGYRAGEADRKHIISEPFSPPIIMGGGGPDGYGHIWIDSDEIYGPTFEWMDISDVGTPVVLGDDDYAGSIPIGFQFPFYEYNVSYLYICSNGMLTFTAGSTVFGNADIPNQANPDNMICVWWDDLNPSAGGDIYYYQDGENDRFVASFEGVPNRTAGGGGTGSLSFQAILYSSGKITLQYGTMDPGADSDGLEGATIGIEDIDGTDGLEVVFNAPYMHDNLAIDIVTDWLNVSPTSGIVDPHDSFDATVTFDTRTLYEGIYTGNINLASNDPLNPSIDIPVTLHVSSQPPPIPTLSQWGIIILALVLLALGTISIVRRQRSLADNRIS